MLVNAAGAKERLIAIEQPELHLHPALQAELGDGWQAYVFAQEERLHPKGKELLKKLKSQKRLISHVPFLPTFPVTDEEWENEALGTHTQTPLTGIVLGQQAKTLRHAPILLWRALKNSLAPLLVFAHLFKANHAYHRRISQTARSSSASCKLAGVHSTLTWTRRTENTEIFISCLHHVRGAIRLLLWKSIAWRGWVTVVSSTQASVHYRIAAGAGPTKCGSRAI